MPIYIDEKFASLLSPKLPLFKWKGDGSANFRCPICGDSQKSKTKKRGYLYPVREKDILAFKCQNCGASHTFNTFLQIVDPTLHKDYIYEAFKFNNDHKWYTHRHEKNLKTVETQVAIESDDPLQHLKRVDTLEPSHECIKYITERKIPRRYWEKLWYADNYCKWINENVVKDKFEKTSRFDNRLVIPFYTKRKTPYAFQGRYIGGNKNAIRYLTVHPDSGTLLVYGFDTVDIKQTIYVLEGPIDSMFVSNSLAVAGSSLKKLLKLANKMDMVFVFDNEPRSPDICKLMEQIIKMDKKIVIWPKSIIHKDVNKMIMNGLTEDDVMKILKENTYSGLTATLNYNNWKKI